ncbi:transketolase [Candidatus Peregrinibacteria bacterium CG11_big_fil_rev_8_21_14_0_20_46_8]|nr:MAG: transketolase [Candidatus Peregrinibacteria bacterium CG11_big_fil_rev_8_21_14_0_20_46_8]
METIATKSFGEVLGVLADRYRNLVVLTGDIVISGIGSSDRVINLGFGHADMIGCAAGLAIAGKIPVVCAPASAIAGQDWEQIRNSIALPNLNVKLIGVSGGLEAAQDGPARQALEDFALMRAMPNMKVFCPASREELRAMLPQIFEDFGPSYLRLGALGVDLEQEHVRFELGKGSLLRGGNDVAVFATGALVGSAVHASDRLAEEGINVRVINLSTIQPIDQELILDTAEQVKIVVTAEEHQIQGGLGSAVAEVLVGAKPKVLHHIGMRQTFGDSGRIGALFRKYRFDAEGVYQQIRALVI